MGSNLNKCDRCLTHHDGAGVPSQSFIDYCRKDNSSEQYACSTWRLPSFAYLHRSFFYTTDQRLQITGGTTCLDYGDNVDPVYGTSLDFSTCTAGNVNQIFTLENVQAVVTNTTFPDPNTICHQGEQEILKPATAANLTQLVRPVEHTLLLSFAERLRSIRAGRFPSSTARRSSTRRRARTSP
jgi:hypothetical protein